MPSSSHPQPYDGLQMLQSQLRGPGTSSHLDRGSERDQPLGDQGPAPGQHILNPKLKQFYEVQTKIEPFYTGGKVVVLSPIHFACQCGPVVKLVSISQSSLLKSEEKDKDGSKTSLHLHVLVEGEEIKIEEDEESGAEEKIKADTGFDSSSAFGIISTFETEMDEILSFDACPSTHTLVTGHKSGLIRVWDTNSREILRTIRGLHGNIPITGLEIYKASSSFGTAAAAASGTAASSGRDQLVWATIAGNTVKLWDAGGNQVSKGIKIGDLPSIGFIKWDYSAKAGSPKLFVAERNIYCIEMDGKRKEFGVSRVLEGHYSQVTGLEWGPNYIMVSGGRDKTLILWNTKQSAYTKIVSLAFPGVIEAMTLISSHDLYIGSAPGTIRHMNLDSRKLSSDISLEWKEGDEAIVNFHPPLNQGHGGDELTEFFVSTHTSTLYQVGKASCSKKHAKNMLQVRKQFVGSLEEILDVALWESNKVVVANNTSVIKYYDLASGSCEFLRGHSDIVLTMGTKREWLVSGSKDNRIIFWKSGSLVPFKVLEGHISSVSGVCFDPSALGIFSVSEDTFLKSWTLERCAKSVVAHEKEIHVVDCSPNGKMVVTGSRDKTAKLWDSTTLQLLATLKGHKKTVWDARFSNWDQLVLTASADTTIKIWNLLSFACVQTLQGHDSSVLKAQFINSGLQIISTSTDGTWRSWDLRSSTCLSANEGSDSHKLWALDCSPDGKLVVTGSGDSRLILWNDITEEKVKESQEKRNRIVQDEQKLANVLRKEDWTEAVRLAIELDKPFALLRILRDVPDVELLRRPIINLSSDYKSQLLSYIEKWNTNGRTSTEAQYLLNLILKYSLPSELHYLKTNSLLPYSEKHFNRLVKTQQQVCLVQFLASENQ